MKFNFLPDRILPSAIAFIFLIWPTLAMPVFSAPSSQNPLAEDILKKKSCITLEERTLLEQHFRQKAENKAGESLGYLMAGFFFYFFIQTLFMLFLYNRSKKM
jgi:hypothetical protein